MKELLPDNVALLKRMQEVNTSSSPGVSSSRMREISDPLSWIFCFLSFVATRVDHEAMRELVAYGQIIIELARKHAGAGWSTYDSLFRQQLAAGSSTKWIEVNPSLMAATILAAPTAASYASCAWLPTTQGQSVL